MPTSPCAMSPPPPAVADTGPLAASPGVVVGPTWRLTDRPAPTPPEPSGDPATERAALTSAADLVRDELHRTRDAATRSAGAAEAAIFDAHLLVLDDADLRSRVDAAIAAGASAASAWTHA